MFHGILPNKPLIRWTCKGKRVIIRVDFKRSARRGPENYGRFPDSRGDSHHQSRGRRRGECDPVFPPGAPPRNGLPGTQPGTGGQTPETPFGEGRDVCAGLRGSGRQKPRESIATRRRAAAGKISGFIPERNPMTGISLRNWPRWVTSLSMMRSGPAHRSHASTAGIPRIHQNVRGRLFDETGSGVPRGGR